MKIIIPSDFYEKHKKDFEKKSFVPKNANIWSKKVEIDLALLTKSKIEELFAFIEPQAKPRTNLAIVLRDIRTWLDAVNGGGKSVKPRNVQQFAAFLTEALREVPGHRVYKKTEDGNWLAYYAASIKFVPAGGRNDRSPPQCIVQLAYQELGCTSIESLSFTQGDVVGRFPLDTLARSGYVVETPELREEYLSSHETFVGLVQRVGLQCLATGFGTDNLDGNPRESYSTDTIRLDINSYPTRVVIDVFQETERARGHDRSDSIDHAFWHKKSVNSANADEEEAAGDADEEVDLDVDEIEAEEVPVHPICAVYDLKRHLRLRVHTGNLKVYEYNTGISKLLVLPPEDRRMVEILLAQKGDFRDIIADKGGGAPILCAGPPGTGKTLTAEVYAESECRPLYSVQCSQLGITPDELEKELLKVFTRAQRWNAILLLDESDVYIRRRGDDLVQNAIVGVILRVLEYYGGVLFLTTNRGDIVDDAIANRCVARLNYKVPPVAEQKQIWQNLRNTSGVVLPDPVIDEITKDSSNLPGRSIKNLLKLSRMIAMADNVEISREIALYAKQFLPTPPDEA